jgi:hypothetical protein
LDCNGSPQARNRLGKDSSQVALTTCRGRDFAARAAVKPGYLMWLEWTDGRISFIRDYKYVRHVIDDAELVIAPDTAPSGKASAGG